MPFAIFEGECSVAEIADRLFIGLTQRQRETATAALLKANPRLARIEAVPRGALLEIPHIPALRAKATTANECPERQVFQLLDAALRTYAEHLAQAQARDQADIEAQVAAMDSDRFTQAISRPKTLIALAKEARVFLEERSQATDERRERVKKAVERATADLEARMKRL
jgi:phage tail protein X